MRALIIAVSIFTSFQLYSQCGTPSMSIWENTWTSCLTSPNPNPERSSGHWIQYEFSEVHQLTKTHVWNTNETGQSQNGLKNVVVDYSTDGTTWKELGTYEFPRGTEEAVYGGFEGFDFEKDSAKYVVITALSNWGGECYGLAEVKFNLWSVTIPCDDPPCYENNECPTPSGLFISNRDETEITLEWEEVEGAEVYIVLFIFDGEELEFEVEEPEITFTDLIENTFYEVIVIAECEEDSSEEAFLSFTTDGGTTNVDNPNLARLSDISLVPNPATSRVNVLFESHISSQGILQVFDLRGVEIKNYPMPIVAGRNSFSINTNDIPDGIYYVTLRVPQEQFTMTKKLVVL